VCDAAPWPRLIDLLYLTRAGVGDPVPGEGAELQAIAAVILGGTSLFGGLIGTLGGVLLMGLTNNVPVILKVGSWHQEIDSRAGHRRRGRSTGKNDGRRRRANGISPFLCFRQDFPSVKSCAMMMSPAIKPRQFNAIANQI
jgi:hypothetical protein